MKLSAVRVRQRPGPPARGERFTVKFYVVAMLFIIFDIETIFLFPWAVAFRELGLFGLVEMAVFIGLVFVAYVYVWRKGGLDWSDRDTDRGAEPDRSHRTPEPEHGRSSVPVERSRASTSARRPRRSRRRSSAASC